MPVPSALIHLSPSPPLPLPSIETAITGDRLTPVFQPIVCIKTCTVFGFEGLIRGRHPEREQPSHLFKAATAAGLAYKLDQNARRCVVNGFAKFGLDSKLFVNILPASLIKPEVTSFSFATFLGKGDIRAEQIVLEIGKSQPFDDLTEIKKTLAVLLSMGFRTALDDLGEAYASLRLWLELRPNYVKIDRQFITGIDRDDFKLQFVRAIAQISETTGTIAIAEGVETGEELLAVRDLGIRYAQGYFLSRPSATPHTSISDDVKNIIGAQRIAVFRNDVAPAYQNAVHAQIGKLVTAIEPLAVSTPNEIVMARFNQDSNLAAIPVVADGIPVGIVRRPRFIQEFARPFRHELYDKRPCALFMDNDPLIVEAGMSIPAVSEKLTELDRRHLASGFIITSDHMYIGMGSGQALVRELTEMQINTARYANPLTLLPGNVPIDEHVERLLGAQISFAAAYVDIDHFKPFNDLYGYRKGDEMIRAVSRTIVQSVDPALDFVGHVGGDDFIVHLQSRDWESRLNAILKAFDSVRAAMLSTQDLQLGTYVANDRKGKRRAIPTPTLSIGVVHVNADAYQCAQAVALALADAKREAKKVDGNSLFLDRRRRLV